MDVEKLATAIRKARDEAEAAGLDRITAPFKETDMILYYLELVKEQEPHVLSWDEMVEAGKNHDAVYLEEHENAYQKRFWGIAIEGIKPPEHGYNYPGGTQFNVVDADDDMWDGDLYGLDTVLGWRAWNRKPTEKQMKAVPWK